AEAFAEVRAPPDLVGRGLPRRDLPPAREIDAAVVDHRGVQQLEGERDLAAVAGQERETGGEAAARGRACESQPGHVDAELSAVRVRPLQRGVAVVEGRGIRMLRRQAVLDGHRRAIELLAPAREEWVV